MKIKIKHLLMMLLCISVSSMMLVSCSDEDESVMGPVAINSCQYTATEVTPIWTLVPNDNCDGYVIKLYKGTTHSMSFLPRPFQVQRVASAVRRFTGRNLPPVPSNGVIKI